MITNIYVLICAVIFIYIQFIQHDDKWSFEEWIKVIDKYYHFYHDTLENTVTQIQNNTLCRNIYMDYQVYIKTDEVENLIALDGLYCELDPETGNYKDFADLQNLNNL